MQAVNSSVQGIRFEEQGRAGIITLARPGALNAVTPGMLRGLEAHLHKWAKAPKIYGVILQAEGRAFSAGGDVRWLHSLLTGSKVEEALQFYREEYQHCWTLECFIKPNVALINGMVMGGGVGIYLYGTHRVAGEDFSFCMPETALGFFPDVGGSYFLSHLSGEMGVYLGLTGERVGAADAWTLGLASHCIPSSKFECIRQALIAAEPVDTLLDTLHRDPEPGPLTVLEPVIARMFSAATVEEILVRLDAESGEHAEWARRTADVLRSRAPLALKVTLRQIREGRNMPNLKEALELEFRLASRFLPAPDFIEGIRAVLLDRDRTPRWRHARLEDVSASEVDAYFAPLGSGELELKDYWMLTD
jgi:enoyl-CoA hydratase